eukprot:TRINITY_DN5868_c0_g1_i1.p1 TRINITY_DN5868_c0_g1~~TRINITY_DN5868_c0_g1_i1.p1  ORF type:complete len:310 (+),score=58.68 TRINITY_DN5868_c0_g1_i1:55-984(+)
MTSSASETFALTWLSLNAVLMIFALWSSLIGKANELPRSGASGNSISQAPLLRPQSARLGAWTSALTGKQSKVNIQLLIFFYSFLRVVENFLRFTTHIWKFEDEYDSEEKDSVAERFCKSFFYLGPLTIILCLFMALVLAWTKIIEFLAEPMLFHSNLPFIVIVDRFCFSSSLFVILGSTVIVAFTTLATNSEGRFEAVSYIYVCVISFLMTVISALLAKKMKDSLRAVPSRLDSYLLVVKEFVAFLVYISAVIAVYCSITASNISSSLNNENRHVYAYKEDTDIRYLHVLRSLEYVTLFVLTILLSKK